MILQDVICSEMSNYNIIMVAEVPVIRITILKIYSHLFHSFQSNIFMKCEREKDKKSVFKSVYLFFRGFFL